MSSCSRFMLLVFNIIILIFAVSQIYTAKTLDHVPSKNPCLRDSASSMPWMGFLLLIMSVIGIIGTCFKLKALEAIYLWLLLLLVITTIIFCTFISALMPKLTAVDTFWKISGKGYWLAEYRPALRTALVNDKDWHVVKTCFKDIKTCEVMANQSSEHKVIYIEVVHLFSFFPPWTPKINFTFMRKNSQDECKMWVKVRVGQECFECDSCKAGYIANYQDQWDKNFGSMIWRIVVLVSASAVAYYTFFDDHGGGDLDPKHGKLVNHI
ncbi:hypothetical protein DH2020_037161 [Rehmannia glutinosa]|uniref:Uncharacterized protein n=1 Tax=Rehmannia glutinosa TaxID=99300 RepID=A0ABR0V2U6_REHGL